MNSLANRNAEKQVLHFATPTSEAAWGPFVQEDNIYDRNFLDSGD